MRTIDADALIKTIGSHCYPVRQENNSIEPGMTQIGILQAIQEQPTIEERKTGKWILWNYPGAECARCSVCGEEYDQIDLYIGGNDYPKFCRGMTGIMKHCRWLLRRLKNLNGRRGSG